MERLADPDRFLEQLRGQSVRIRVIRHWSPLDPRGRLRSIATVLLGAEELFTAM